MGSSSGFIFLFFIFFAFVGTYHKAIDLSLESQITYQSSFWVLIIILIKLHEVRNFILNVNTMMEWAQVRASTKWGKGGLSLTASWLNA